MGVEIPFELRSGRDSEVFMRAFYFDAVEKYGPDGIRVIDYDHDVESIMSSVVTPRSNMDRLGLVIDTSLNGSLIAAARDVLSFLESYRALGFIDVAEKDLDRVRAMATSLDLSASVVVGYEPQKATV